MNIFHMVKEYEPDTYMDFRQGELIKNQISQSCLLVPNTLSRYDLAICEVSRMYSIWFRCYEPGVKKA